MPFATVAIPHAAYAALPNAQSRWLLMCLARYADRDGRCWPSMRQLAVDARMSLASVCRYLRSMAELGVFQRERRPGGRFQYLINETLRPRWKGCVPLVKHPVPRDETREAFQAKHQDSFDDSGKWEARLRGWQKRRMWLNWWGPKPSEPGCWAPGVRG